MNEMTHIQNLWKKRLTYPIKDSTYVRERTHIPSPTRGRVDQMPATYIVLTSLSLSLYIYIYIYICSIKQSTLSKVYIYYKKKCLLPTKNFWQTQKALSKYLICDGKIKPLQILGKMWNICDQQKKLSQLCVIAVTNTNILEENFPSILFARNN